MGRVLDIVTPLHVATKRDYLGRMNDEKSKCMEVAKQYDVHYWDGARRFGYGGYRFIPGRWRPVAEALIKEYDLSEASRVLDVGCGKGYLLYELKALLPKINVSGFDASKYALANAHPEVQESLFLHRAQDEYPFEDGEFDLVLSLGCLHNLKLSELHIAIPEIQRVGQTGYIMLESYRNTHELCNLQCWALTAESFMDVGEWCWLYNRLGYKGDYEFIFFE